MTISVRVYSHAGLSTPPVKGTSGRFTSDSLFLLKQPYLGGEVISVGTGTAVASASATAPAGTAILHVQVPPGARAYYEVTPGNGSARTATTSSPIIEGNTQIEFGAGWTISVLEVS